MLLGVFYIFKNISQQLNQVVAVYHFELNCFSSSEQKLLDRIFKDIGKTPDLSVANET